MESDYIKVPKWREVRKKIEEDKVPLTLLEDFVANCLPSEGEDNEHEAHESLQLAINEVVSNLQKENEDMREKVELLDMLEVFGVDNWEGYGLAQMELEKPKEEREGY